MKFIKNTRWTIWAKIYGIWEIHIWHSTEGKDNLINILEQKYSQYFPWKQVSNKTKKKLLKLLS